MKEGAEFFKKLLKSNIDKICIENPIPHKYGLEIIGQKYTQVIHPYMFGHMEKKATCLWLKNLPQLHETDNVKFICDMLPKKFSHRINYISPSPDRWKERSKTFQGIADAMANQWG
jgi:hypothetical protein